MIDVALATTSIVEDPDLPLLATALDDLGCSSVAVAWDDPGFDWSTPGVTVLRSTWNYAARHESFLRWVRSVPRLVNPSDVVGWNVDKHYLADLASRGVPVVPTTYATDGGSAPLPVGGVVVKPAVGAGSRGAGRFGAEEHEAARRHVDEIAARGQVALVQPYLASAERGEVDVAVVDGVVSHAVRKVSPMGLAVDANPQGPLSVDAVEPSAPVLAVVGQVLEALPFDTLCYARVDMIEDDDGPVVLEVELIEPYLFLAYDDGAAGRLAAAIARRLAGPHL